MKKQHVQLTDAHRSFLEDLLRKGDLPVKTYRRALALLELDRGKSYTTVAQTLTVASQTLSIWAAKYEAEGLQMLVDQARAGRPVIIDGTQRAKVTALACSDPPAGYAQWSLRLLADKVVELGYCETISHTLVGDILKKTS
ncbi:MAG: helix-turn-helix domain-containing protein [Anaerolineales bacterium]|nr:helix-turn-helix domain-containing protein [Anaerolineales bacterium]